MPKSIKNTLKNIQPILALEGKFRKEMLQKIDCQPNTPVGRMNRLWVFVYVDQSLMCTKLLLKMNVSTPDQKRGI